MKSRKAQLTIFIIIAIIIVAVIILIFATGFNKTIVQIISPSKPLVNLQNCVNKKLAEGIKIVSASGGSITPVNYYLNKGDKIEYLCYTNEYYQTCVNQQPLLKQHIERELLEYIKTDTRKCIDDAIQNLRDSGYDVQETNKEINIELNPKKINIIIPGLIVRKNDEGISYQSITTEYKSNLYDFAMITNSILNFEARYGDSDITTYMLYYPYMKVEKYKQDDGSKIYILTNTNDKDKFVFATRSLSWPDVIGFNEIQTPFRG